MGPVPQPPSNQSCYRCSRTNAIRYLCCPSPSSSPSLWPFRRTSRTALRLCESYHPLQSARNFWLSALWLRYSATCEACSTELLELPVPVQGPPARATFQVFRNYRTQLLLRLPLRQTSVLTGRCS